MYDDVTLLPEWLEDHCPHVNGSEVGAECCNWRWAAQQVRDLIEKAGA